MMRDCGAGAELAKCDIKSAFRLLPVHPADFELLSFSFKGNFMWTKLFPWVVQTPV